MEIKYGSQSFAWQMNYKNNKGKVPHILSVIKEAGFYGAEFEVDMLGDYYEANTFARELERSGLILSGVALVQRWLGERETEEEIREAKKAIEFSKRFAGAKLILCQLPCSDRKDLLRMQEAHIKNIASVRERANDLGVECVYHTNSSDNSIFRSYEDYHAMFDLLNEANLWFAPDIGHIVHAGMDAVEIIKECRLLIRYMHLKDVDRKGNWVSMGNGIVDFPRIVTYLEDTGYQGWIVVEEESQEAVHNPDRVTLKNGAYVSSYLLSLAQ